MSLSSTQLSILASHAEVGDHVAYYETLKSFGENYAELALQVVLNSGVAVDLSRFSAAPSARLGHFPFESDGAFPAES
ncbi:hypothetical protein ASD8599_03100 [Ascidiaceihabitans donghaensis]|uniref:Uncharacterized protein n=1 Tax=Ascidiaceihabitans donghaensis TaxID=1510460 RepID=A0A2R8BH68_9RHOB|nr:hypothetical protein [Ascidiaceihabitans donghaensis]SPH22357.1 hypothetical protein ASD8599_03100 [Ascidiaceihabitans donghaensis]